MLTILVPASGLGSRFTAAGYRKPKPFIDVAGDPMLTRVLRNVRPSCTHSAVVILRREQAAHCHIGGATVMLIDGVTEGAACTALLARSYFDNDDPLMIVNSDQLLDWDVDDFLASAQGADGSIVTFTASDPKWSYVRKHGRYVVEVAEKRVISDEATCGVYWWRRGRDFARSVETMIAQNDRFNGEFYIAPSYNHLIAEGARITTYRLPDDAMHGLGTPTDLENYLGIFQAQAA